MKKLTKPAVLAVAFLFLFAAVQTLHSEDDAKKSKGEKAAAKKEAKKDDKKDEAKDDQATRLPRYYNQIGLSDDQKAKVRKIAEQYETQIADLKKQLADIQAKRDKEQEGLLSDAQKKNLAAFIAEAKRSKSVSKKNQDPSLPLKAAGKKFSDSKKGGEAAKKGDEKAAEEKK